MKRAASNEEFVNESVEFFNERVNQLVSQLHESALTPQLKTVLENEKKIILERRDYWKLEQSRLLLCD